MVKVSNLFKSKIYAPERTIKGKVSFEILDVTAYEDASFTVSSEAEISRLNQAINKIRETSNKYATFERDYFKLDGTYYIPPRENEGDSELGWWSDEISGQDGYFLNPPTVEFTFTEPHSSIGLTLTFDKKTDEYASEIRIQAFSETGTVLADETILGINSTVYHYDTLLDGYSRLVVTILRWAKPFRRSRLIEVDFGVVREYSGDKLISLKVIEEMDLLASTVPSNEMQFVLDNSDQAFNILNPNGIYRFLIPNQEMTADIGLLIGQNKYEWIPMGKYYLTEWTVEEGAMTSTFVGRDIFTALDLVDYKNLLQNTNLYDLAVDILTEAKIERYEIDESLKDISTFGFMQPIKMREALQMLAIAGASVVRQGRNGEIIIEQYEEMKAETGYVTFAGQEIAGASTVPQVYIDYELQSITFDNVFDAPKIKLAQQVTHLVFKIHSLSSFQIPPKGHFTGEFLANTTWAFTENQGEFAVDTTKGNKVYHPSGKVFDVIPSETSNGIGEMDTDMEGATKEGKRLIFYIGQDTTRFVEHPYYSYDHNFIYGYEENGIWYYSKNTTLYHEWQPNWDIDCIVGEFEKDSGTIGIDRVTQYTLETMDKPTENTRTITIYNAAVREGIGYEINNPLIDSEELALKVAEWMFRDYNYIAEFEAKWRQNPALELGSVILIEDSFGNKKKSRITKSEFDYAGYLDGITQAKGGI